MFRKLFGDDINKAKEVGRSIQMEGVALGAFKLIDLLHPQIYF